MSEETTKLKVKYENTTSQYASQCVLNSKDEVVFLEFASDVVPDPETGQINGMNTAYQPHDDTDSSFAFQISPSGYSA